MRPHADPAASTSTVQPRPEPGLTWRTIVALLALALAARLPAYWVNENWLGDAIPRTDLARKWAVAPHWISSFSDGAAQFGPLHLYVVGAALKLGASRQRAGRSPAWCSAPSPCFRWRPSRGGCSAGRRR